MAWIESHQELAGHPKTKKFARLIGASLPTAVGHLHFLWWWAMDYAQDGDLSKYDAEDIADACGWDGEPSEILSALIDSRFVDQTDAGLSIHDWDDYAGRLIDKRKANAERKRKSRERHASVTRDTRSSHRATVPNHTKPNQKNTAAIAHACEEPPEPTKTGQDESADQPAESFYSAYERSFGRQPTPLQAEQLGKYIDEDGMEEAVVVRAIERAAAKSGNFNLVRKIMNDYFDGGIRTLQQAIAADEQYEVKARGEPKGRADPQAQKAAYFAEQARKEREREQSGDLEPV